MSREKWEVGRWQESGGVWLIGIASLMQGPVFHESITEVGAAPARCRQTGWADSSGTSRTFAGSSSADLPQLDCAWTASRWKPSCSKSRAGW